MTYEKSNERVVAALNAVKIMCDHGKDIKFDGIAEAFSVSPGTFSALKGMGIVVSKGGRKYEWIGAAPSVKLCNTLKQWAEDRYRGKKILDSNDEDKTFESMKIDDKINHINFMLDQIFERVEYLFDNLADNKTKTKVDSEWFTKK